jgi:uncharacterized protein
MRMGDAMSWLVETVDGVVVTVRVTPRAARAEVSGMQDDCLRVRLPAPPVDGKANKALLIWLAETLAVPKSTVRLVAGAKSRVKRVLIAGSSAASVRRALEPGA